MTLLKQVAAIPYVETSGGHQVLLITTRGRGRWTIPKGWVKPAVANSELAGREAFQEAGIAGEVDPRPIGSYGYTKRLHIFSWAKCSVEVYLLRAVCQHLSWPERESRRSLWVPPSEAATMVDEPDLAAIFLGLTATLANQPDAGQTSDRPG